MSNADYYEPRRAASVEVSKPVDPVPSPKPVKQSRDRAQYVRQQKGHSAILGWLLVGPLTCFIVPIYWSVSPNHYWHL